MMHLLGTDCTWVIRKEAPCRDPGERWGLDPSGNCGGGEKWLDLRYILKGDVIGLLRDFRCELLKKERS